MSVTRRRFLVAVPAAGAAVALVPFLAGRRSPQSPGGSEAAAGPGEPVAPGAPREPVAPVVSFHLDQPYLDVTGLETPYVPPAGMRSGAPLAALNEEEVFGRFYGFI